MYSLGECRRGWISENISSMWYLRNNLKESGMLIDGDSKEKRVFQAENSMSKNIKAGCSTDSFFLPEAVPFGCVDE